MKNTLQHFLNPKQNQVVLIILNGLLLSLLVYLRFGYGFLEDDQFVLSLRGLTLADPQALLGDWFVKNATQPHWLFDYFTFIGERLHLLDKFYFAFWLLQNFIFTVAFDRLAAQFIPSYTKLRGLLLPLLLVLFILGPFNVLGGLGPIYRLALPHLLGVSLVLLGLSYFLNNEIKKGLLLFPLIVVVHIHHGMIYLVLSFLYCNIASKDQIPIRFKVVLNLVACLLVMSVALLAWRLGLIGSNDNFEEICKLFISGHCYAPAWPPQNFYPIIPVFLPILALYILMVSNKGISVKIIFSLLPLTLIFSLASDYYDLPFFSWIARRLFLNRFIAYCLPLSCLGLVVLFEKSRRALVEKQFFISVLLISLLYICLFSWLAAQTAMIIENTISLSLITAVIISLFLFLTFLFNYLKIKSERTVYLMLIPLFFYLFISNYLSFNNLQNSRYSDSIEAVKSLGLKIKELTPPHSLILAPPGAIWLRTYSRRAVVVDVKYIPYSGEALEEYKKRIKDFGGFDYSSFSFQRLSFDSLLDLVKKYSPNYLLLSLADPKLQQAIKRWKLILIDKRIGLAYFSLETPLK